MYMYLQYVTNVTFDFTNFTIEFTIAVLKLVTSQGAA